MRVARASFTRRAWVMMAVAAISAAAIAVLLLAIVTEAGWNVKRCCTEFEPEPETMNQPETMLQKDKETGI